MKFGWKFVAPWVAASAVASSALAADAPAVQENSVLVRMARGENIAESDLAAYLQRRVDLRQAARNAWGIQTALREMALTKSLMMEGAELGVERVSGKGSGVSERFDDAYAHVVYKKMAPVC